MNLTQLKEIHLKKEEIEKKKKEKKKVMMDVNKLLDANNND